uniref:F-box domain-containing protein n=1 Tax=Meloidogyne hapla TaxID=6305 RepID=A0A1I8BHV3_MELHA
MQSLRLLNELKNSFTFSISGEEQNEKGFPIDVKIFPHYENKKEILNQKEEEKENLILNSNFDEKINENKNSEKSEEEEILTEEELKRLNRRLLFPTEIINEILNFLSFNECARIYTSNRLICGLLEPRRKVCMEVVHLQEVGQRREHISQLTDHIGVINARLEDMGSHLKELDAQILDNHQKLNSLHERIEKMRVPSIQQLNEEMEENNK